MKRILIPLAVVILLGIGGVVMAVMIACRDIPPPDTTDLIPERSQLPPEQNAYTYFVSATNSFYWPTDDSPVIDYLDDKPVDDGAIQEIVTRNANMMDLIGKGLECQRCLTPEVTGLTPALPYIRLWRNIRIVMAVKTKHDRLAGRYGEATSTCISLVRFGDMIQNDAEGFIDYLVGVAILDMGLMQAQDLARDKGTAQEELTRLSEALAALGPFDRGLIRAIKVEYKVAANTIDRFRDGMLGMDKLGSLGDGKPNPMLEGKRIPGYFLQPNKTKLTFANFYRDRIKNARLPYASVKRYDVDALLGPDENSAKLIPQPNRVGRTLYGILMPDLDGLFELKCRAECNVAATRLIAACNAYQKKEGKWPEELQSLVPKYLAAIPHDPYDGKPFRYSSSKGIVYSVGKDLKDSGGSSKLPEGYKGHKGDTPSKRRWKAEDIVFEIKDRIEQSPGDVLKAAPQK